MSKEKLDKKSKTMHRVRLLIFTAHVPHPPDTKYLN